MYVCVGVYVCACVCVCMFALMCLAAEPSFTQKMLSMSLMYIKQIKAELLWSYSMVNPSSGQHTHTHACMHTHTHTHVYFSFHLNIAWTFLGPIPRDGMTRDFGHGHSVFIFLIARVSDCSFATVPVIPKAFRTIAKEKKKSRITIFVYVTAFTTAKLPISLAKSKVNWRDFPGGAVVKNLPANAGDMGLIPGLGRFHMPRTTKPECHNYWACALEPASHNYWAHVP